MPIKVGLRGLPANPLCVDADTCFTLVDDTLTLTVNGQAVQEWKKRVVSLVPPKAGEPIGLLLALTYDVDQ